MSDYESRQRRRNITVGLFVILALLSLVWLVYKFQDLPSFVSKIGSYRVVIQFPTAQGIQQDTPVRFAGYQIGQVVDVKPPEPRLNRKTGEVYHQTQVVVRIDDQFQQIPSNVEAKLVTRGFGSSYIELEEQSGVEPEPVDANRPETRFLQDNMLLQGTKAITSEFFPAETQQKLDQLATSVNTLMENANDIIGDEENKENIKQMLANLAATTDEATKTLASIREFSQAGKSALKGAEEKTTELVEGLLEVAEELGKATSEIRMLLEKVNKGQGSMARLLNDARLYENLLDNTEQLEMLLDEIRRFVASARVDGVPINLK